MISIMDNNLERLENRLWDAADQLRANSNLNSSEYFMPIMGLIFLRHAYNRFLKVKKELEPTLPKRGGVTRPLTKDDFARKSALFLREESQFDYLLNLPSEADRGQAIIKAMEAIEEDYPEQLAGVLPKNYFNLDNDLLGNILKIFNDETLRTANGDVFGRIYEYFLMKFAMQQAQDDGEFFTPVSLVQMIVNVIEPDHGIVFDPAEGSGGMFVQSSHFIEGEGKVPSDVVTFYGQEKSSTTIRLAKMNLAVHGLEGNIVEANTFYEDRHEMLGKADYVMANPPFNVDGVDAEKVKGDARLPFGLPGVNKKGAVGNGNYLWISYFYSYLNAAGRAGFVMSSQASSAGHGEKEVRRKIVETGHVDVMIAIRSNFFYTRSVPCELWFFDKAKPEYLKNKVLMLDARNIFRKVTRKIYDFSPEQLQNLTAVVWLYRGQTEKFLNLVCQYLESLSKESGLIEKKLTTFEGVLDKLIKQVDLFISSQESRNGQDTNTHESLQEAVAELHEAVAPYRKDRDALTQAVRHYITNTSNISLSNEQQHAAQTAFEPIADQIRGLIKQVDLVYKLLTRSVDIAEKDLGAKSQDSWDTRASSRFKKEIDAARKEAVERLRQANYFYRQIVWLQHRFPEAKFRDVEGLTKLVDVEEIKANDWSLTPGRYVGVAPLEEDEDFDFEETLRDIHLELVDLNVEAIELAKTIQVNFEELGV